jgi:hypothetical protein
MLMCETNTKLTENNILDEFKDLSSCHHDISTYFEHGQWWVTCLDCGASWSVNDCETDGIDCFSFERIDQGDEYCLQNEGREVE